MNGNSRPDIRSLSYGELDHFFTALSQPKFRTKQVYEWLWKKGCRSFGEMTNLPVSLRDTLIHSFSFPVMQEATTKVSQDGTRKTGFRLADSLLIESVLIPADDRTTACISSQAGCALGCTFCATGMMGFYRNLTAAEMFDQVWTLNEQSRSFYHTPLSNIVLMGMGEPLFNYPQVMRVLELITGKEGMGISPQRITLSSVGIPKMIRQLADDQARVHLAISLHASNNGKRNKIVPINQRFPLEDLTDSLKYYHRQTGKRFTIEYLLLRDFNDSLQDAAELAGFCRNFPVKINLIEYNPVSGADFRRSEIKRMKEFRDFLESRNLVVNIRKSRGKDIDAACGQLIGKEEGRRTRDEG